MRGRTDLSFMVATVLVFSIISTVTSVFVTGDATAHPGLSMHDPISIEGNEEFTADNGVVRGSGTPLDPYVIEGWEIKARGSAAINILRTDASFIVKNIRVTGSTGDWAGVRLFWTENGLILDSHASLICFECVNISVRGNDVPHPGISFRSSSRVTAETNDLKSSDLRIERSTEATLRGNTLTSGGVVLDGHDPSHYTTHTITGDNLVNGKPIRYHADCGLLRIENASTGQVLVAGCADVSVANLTISDTTAGIQLAYVSVVEITNVSIQETESAMTATGVGNITIKKSVFTNNLGGVDIQVPERVDVISSEFSSNEEFGLRIRNTWRDPASVNLIDNSVTDNDDGMIVYQVDLASVASNAFERNRGVGLRLGGWAVNIPSKEAEIANNLFSENRAGLELRVFASGSVAANDFRENGASGLLLWGSTMVSVTGNRFVSDGIEITGVSWEPLFEHYASHTFTNNTVNGLPFHYAKDSSDLALSGIDAGQIYVVNSTGIRVANETITNTATAIMMAFVSDVSIENVSLSSNRVGLKLFQADDIRVEQTRLMDNYHGIRLSSSTDAKILNSRILSNKGDGISAAYSFDVHIAWNLISGNGVGVNLVRSSNVTVESNGVAENGKGVYAHGYAQDCPSGCFYTERGIVIKANAVHNNRIGLSLSAWDVIVTDNEISGNSDIGISLHIAIAVRIYHNAFIQNGIQASETSGHGHSSINDWDNGYPSGGNYWSDYQGEDECMGPSQDICPAPDGIGDTPYPTGVYTSDRYPLMAPERPQRLAPVAGFKLLLSEGVPLRVTVNASASYDDEDPAELLEVRWDWEDDGIWDTPWSTDKIAAHDYEVLDNFRIRLQVRDTDGFIGEFAQMIPDRVPPRIFHSPTDSTTPSPSVTVEVRVEDISDILRVTLYYRPGDQGDFLFIAMNLSGVQHYSAEIPAPTRPSFIQYYIVAIDGEGNAARSPPVGEYQMRIALKPGAPLSPPARAVVALVGVSLGLSIYYLFRKKRSTYLRV